MKRIKSHYLRYGGYATLLTLMVISITIILNIIITDLNLKIDTTTEKLYSLSTNTEKVVSNLDTPIHIYVLEETGKETIGLKEALMKYDKLSSNLDISYKDPILYPTFANAYKKTSSDTISTGSVIIENTVTGKYKVLSQNDLYDTVLNSNNEVTLNHITIENAITNALGYVSTTVDATIYYTVGHSELTLPTALKDSAKRANLSLEEIDLLTTDMPTPENSIMLVYSPHTDFTKDEIKKMTDFLDQGGKAMLFMDANMPELTHYNELLNYYGVSYEQGVVIENNTNYSLRSYPTYLLPKIATHDITKSLIQSKLPVVIPFASGIKIMNHGRNGVTLAPLLSTSDESYLKKDISANTQAFEEGDVSGPIMLACAIEENNTLDVNKPINTRLFIMANSFFLDDKMTSLDSTGNKELLTNAFGWLFSIDNSYAIEGKSLQDYTLRSISNSQLVLCASLTMAIIPLIILVLGVTVWIKRRHL